MRKIMVLVMATICFVPAIAEVFDIPANGVWVKVQDNGDTIQWSAIPATQPKTRIDLMSYLQDGNWVSYYLIRSACADGTVASYVIKPGNMLGVGVDCNGDVVAGTSAPLGKVKQLPPEAARLLKH